MSDTLKIQGLMVEMDALKRQVENARAVSAQYLLLGKEVRLMAKEGATPDGDGVNISTLLWAEEWAGKLTAAEFKGSEDPRCMDGGEACTDCLRAGECLKCNPSDAIGATAAAPTTAPLDTGPTSN
jgi:hypothetical protein